jgi:glutamine amidotransferase-like uncharacterized protein
MTNRLSKFVRTGGRALATAAITFTCSFTLSASAAPTGLNVGIYSGTGAESSTILAMFRAVAAMGHSPKAITKSDIVNGRLTRSNFDVFVIPPGEDGKKCCADHYADIDGLDQIATKTAMRDYLTSGGGLVAEEAGAYFCAQNGGTFDVYSGNYTNISTNIGKKNFNIVDANFGAGSQEVWQSYGGGYFPTPPGNVSVVARDTSNNAVIVRQIYGAGRIIMTSYVLELRGDSELDWTIWDNWAMGGVHNNSLGAWSMLGRMIGYAYNGDSSAPTVNPPPNPPGQRVAVVAQHTTDGGAWSGLLPAVGRGIESTGHVPLAIRFQEIKDSRLTLANFKVVVFPGGYAYGYKTGLAGHEAKIRSFISSGGSYYGICAGSFYAPDTITWERKNYTYPLGIYKGMDIGPIDDIAPWPQYVLTQVNFSGDTVIGNVGLINVMYYGGGYHTIPTDAQQGSHVYTAGTFAYSGSARGKADLVRYSYGLGRVALTTTHLEARAGSNDDWLYWDDYLDSSNTPVLNPDNPWIVMGAIFNNWLTLP